MTFCKTGIKRTKSLGRGNFHFISTRHGGDGRPVHGCSGHGLWCQENPGYGAPPGKPFHRSGARDWKDDPARQGLSQEKRVLLLSLKPFLDYLNKVGAFPLPVFLRKQMIPKNADFSKTKNTPSKILISLYLFRRLYHNVPPNGSTQPVKVFSHFWLESSSLPGRQIFMRAALHQRSGTRLVFFPRLLSFALSLSFFKYWITSKYCL